MQPDITDRLLTVLGKAHGEYFGEPVTQLQHALQCAHLAQAAGSDDELVAAALLHDIGHLIAEGDENGAADHDAVGAEYLRALGCSDRLAALVGGHVEAKRYLTAVKPEYYEQLSEVSKQSLAEQGGPMPPDEVSAFQSDPLFAAKLRLRTWDERAKDPAATVPGLDTYRDLLARL